MVLEKNAKTRPVVRRLLELTDRVSGSAFPHMKRVRQITVYHCGPAVLVELFSYLGIRLSQTGVVRSLRAQRRIKKYGLNIHDLARATSALGKRKFTFWKKANAGVRDLSLIVNKYNYPVGVEWQGIFYEFADEDDGHYGVVTQIDRKKGTLRLADSFHAFAGVDRRLKVANFVKRWWDINIVKGRRLKDIRMMFVITPKSETWPKRLGMAKAF